jgi:hypothetical protein
MPVALSTVGSPLGTPQSFSAASSAPSSALQAPAAAPALPLRSPQIIQDPMAGYITQYINSAGDLVSQAPSARAVAYLRQGLTASGMPKSNPVAEAVA